MIDPAAYAERTNSESAHQIALFMAIARMAALINEDECVTSVGYGKFTREQVRLLSLLFAVPNGNERSHSVGGILKAEGVKAGVPDLFLPVPAARTWDERGERYEAFHGLWIEMKRPATATQKAGVVSKVQEQWHADLIGQGFACVVCYTWLEAVETLWKYLNGRLEQNNAID